MGISRLVILLFPCSLWQAVWFVNSIPESIVGMITLFGQGIMIGGAACIFLTARMGFGKVGLEPEYHPSSSFHELIHNACF